MDDRSSPGNPQAVAALLRPMSDAERNVRGITSNQQRPDATQRPKPAQPANSSVRKPVLETSEFRVVEPDGTEDPWASADDGLVPDTNAGNSAPSAGRKS